MLTSLSLVFLVGLSLAAICEKIRLPRIVSMIAAGIMLDPYVLNLLDPQILGISSKLRQMALIIILIKAGLSLDLSDLKKIGRPAVLMSFVPASFEILGYVLFAPLFLGVSRIEAALMGAVLSAVSPAVVIPRMLRLMEEKRGIEKGIPQLIMAGASCDDMLVIVLFAAFSDMAQGGTVRLLDFVNSSLKVLIILSVSFLLVAMETWAKSWVAVSGWLAVVSMTCVLKAKSTACVIGQLSEKFGKLWFAAEVILFVLVGAAVGYSLYAQRRNCRCLDNRCRTDIPCRRCGALLDRNAAHQQGTPFLRDRLSAESDCAGGDRLSAAFDGAALREHRSFGRRTRHFDHGSARRAGN